MASQQEREELKRQLTEDVAQARQTVESAGETRGVQTNTTEDFLPRSIRVKQRTLADTELEDLRNQINKTVKELSTEAAFSDELEQSKFESSLRARLNRGALAAITQGLEFDKRLKEQKMDAEKSARMWGLLSGGIASATAYGVGNSGSKQRTGTRPENLDFDETSRELSREQPATYSIPSRNA